MADKVTLVRVVSHGAPPLALGTGSGLLEKLEWREAKKAKLEQRNERFLFRHASKFYDFGLTAVGTGLYAFDVATDWSGPVMASGFTLTGRRIGQWIGDKMFDPPGDPLLPPNNPRAPAPPAKNAAPPAKNGTPQPRILLVRAG